MGEKAIIAVSIGIVLMVLCGSISLVEYVMYLLRTTPFWGVLAGWGFILGVILSVLGMVGMYGDK